MNWFHRTMDKQIESGVQLPVEIQCAGASDIGLCRETNDDHFLIADLHKNMHVRDSSVQFDSPELFGQTMGNLLFVADGIGGARAGDVASSLAICEMCQHLLNSMHWLFFPRQPEIEQFVSDLKSGAYRSHLAVQRDSEENPEHFGMGTTLTVAYLFWPMLYVLHVGDSRCYVLRNGSIQRLTKDQTLAQVLLDQGQINTSEFNESPYSNLLVSSIGGKNDPEAVVYKTRLLPGDKVMLCTDGVNAHLTDENIETILAKDHSPEQIVAELISEAKKMGGRDNITAVVAGSQQIQK